MSMSIAISISLSLYIYIYTYIERERERDIIVYRVLLIEGGAPVAALHIVMAVFIL